MGMYNELLYCLYVFIYIYRYVIMYIIRFLLDMGI
jgi:hypothetical protein